MHEISGHPLLKECQTSTAKCIPHASWPGLAFLCCCVADFPCVVATDSIPLFQVNGGGNASSWCRTRSLGERSGSAACSDAALGATREGMIITLSKGVLGKRLQRAVLKFVKQHLLAPANSSCFFNILQMRCEPSAMCHMDHQKGDLTPWQSCRLISKAESTEPGAPCRWDSAQLRCEQRGVCRPDVWRWARRGLRRRVLRGLLWAGRVRRVLEYMSTVSLVAIMTPMRSKDLGQNRFLSKLSPALLTDSLVQIREQFARVSRRLLVHIRNLSEDPSTLLDEMHTSFNNMVVWHRVAVKPRLKRAFNRCRHLAVLCSSTLGDVSEQHRLKVAEMVQGLAATSNATFHALKTFLASVPGQLAYRSAQLFQSTWDLDPIRDRMGSVKLSAAKAACGALNGTQAALQRAGHHISTVRYSARRWKCYAIAAYRRIVKILRAAGACPCEYVPSRGMTVTMSPTAARFFAKATTFLGKYTTHARASSRRLAGFLHETQAQLDGLRQQASREIEAEINTIVSDHNELCEPIPAEEQGLLPSWQFYSPYSAKKTASKIYGRILHQIMI